jgi:asparagine synthase (glutamine-hydrolysing)
MCGIAGILGYQAAAAPVSREELLMMREAMAKRGPDGSGLWLAPDGRVGLAHRRLAIIDLSEAGAQPMGSEDGSLQAVFNGEIYNYRELRRQLEADGYRFSSQSDTEVLLHLYRKRGPELVRHLRGMYAFALWDEKQQALLLARDPFGIKPLYYADNGHTFRFASQVKALIRAGGVDTAPEPAGHTGFFLWGCVPDPFTLYRGVRALPAGSVLRLQRAGPAQITAFADISQEMAAAGRGFPEAGLPAGERARLVRQAMADTVQHHLVAEVPVGVFLSAGKDSSVLTALAREFSGELRTFTLGFQEYRGTIYDETRLAGQTAGFYRTDHREGWVSRQDFREALAPLLAAMDQPSTDGVNTYFVAREAARTGLKVAFSGLGGDELCGGYPSFRDLPRLVKTLRPFRGLPGLGRWSRRLAAWLLPHFTSPKYAGLLEYGGNFPGAYLLRRGLFMPWELEQLLGEKMAREGWEELQPLANLAKSVPDEAPDRVKVAALEMTWYMRHQLLRDADWAGMAHSLEIRVPLVDLELLRRLGPLLAAARPLSKEDLVRSPAPPLPEELLRRPKTGFRTPFQEWLQESFISWGQQWRRDRRGWALLLHRHFTGQGNLPEALERSAPLRNK